MFLMLCVNFWCSDAVCSHIVQLSVVCSYICVLMFFVHMLCLCIFWFVCCTSYVLYCYVVCLYVVCFNVKLFVCCVFICGWICILLCLYVLFWKSLFLEIVYSYSFTFCLFIIICGHILYLSPFVCCALIYAVFLYVDCHLKITPT